MQLPIRTFEDLYHCGTLNIQDRGEQSFEGNTLSVSVHPLSWVRIMKKGGDIHCLNEPTRLVDLYAFLEDNEEAVITWGLETD